MNKSGTEKITYTSNYDYHLRQYKAPYRSTVSLVDYLKRNLDTKKIRTVLDLGCGGGANIYWLRKEFPHWQFTGVDFDPEAIQVCRQQNPDQRFFCEDILNLKDSIRDSSFDLVLSIQVIVTAPFSLYDFLKAALPFAQSELVMTSLFSEDYFEQDTIRRDLQKNKSYVYKIDSLKKLEDWVKDKNIDMSFEEITIDVDLPKPDPLTLSTYTVKLENGKRLQISPYMLMPWYVVRLTK